MLVAEGRTTTILAISVAVVLACVLILVAARSVHAATFTVTDTADSGDDTCDAACTLREAINAANASSGTDTITFDIPGADTGCDVTSGVCTIRPSSALPKITGPVIIDAYSQPGATPNTLAIGNDAAPKIELSGTDAPPNTSGIRIEAADSTVQGLVVSDWENGIFLGIGATGNTVRGNFIGTDASDTQGLGNNIGVVALDADNTIGGTTAAARNTISNNGFGVEIASATGGNKVQGNYIGTDATGTLDRGNNIGVAISSTPDNVVGGTTAAARNVISGNHVFGIRIFFTDATGNKVQGNYIGTDASGTEALGNGNDGVIIAADADNNTIGGTRAKAGNLISGNAGDGVEVNFVPGDPNGGATGNSILSNFIYNNDFLGIDLVHTNDPPGVTLNDEDDNDFGPNRLQNHPEITSARLLTMRIDGRRKKVTVIKGTLNSGSDETFNIQFFGSPEADNPPHGLTGYGEGKRFLGQKSVTTNDSGDATFTFKTKKKVPKGQVVTSTATNQASGDTSEFSRAVVVN